MRLLSNIIKSTKINFSDNNCFNIDVPEIYKKKPENIEPEITEYIEQTPNETTSEDLQKLLDESQKKADEIVADAQNQAQEIINNALQQAQQEIEQRKGQAEESGYQEGYNKAIAEVDKLKAKANEELKSAQKQKEEILSSAEPQIVELILKISENLFNKALKFNPQTIAALVKKGLSQASSKDNLIIHVSVDDYTAAKNGLKEFKEFVGEGAEIEIFRDTSLNCGDCIIETSFGNIDCSFETQFEQIKKEIIYILENR